MKKNSLILICLIVLTACAPVTATAVPVVETATPTFVPAANTARPAALWVAPAVPAPLREKVLASGVPLAADVSSATQVLDVADLGSLWVYALVAPFATVVDDITY